MKTAIIAGLIAAGFAVAGPVYASAELAASNKCSMCHDIEKKKTGPSYKDIAANHKGKAADEATVVAKLMKGDGHKKVTASEADVKTIVKWILAM